MTNPAPERLPSPFATGLACRCPRCGEGPLFSGFLKTVQRCESCGLDLSYAAHTEGPAVFIILIVGFVIVGAAAVVEGLFHPPPFVHLLLWLPSVVILALALMRPLKATMVALQFHNRSGEGGWMTAVVEDQPLRGGRFWGFLVFMLALMALFMWLGTWQLERLAEKERLIADVAARAGEPPKPFPDVAEWTALDAGYDFRPVSLTGTYRPQGTVLVFTSLADQRGSFSGPGYWVMTPFVLATGGTVFVNRGFVPQASGAAFAEGGSIEPGLISIEGVARSAEMIGGFTPAPDMARRVEWVRYPPRLASMAGDLPLPVAPVYVDLPAGPPGTLPQGGETVVEFPNNHLGYAMTWYGFALLVPFLLFFWVRRQQAEPDRPAT